MWWFVGRSPGSGGGWWCSEGDLLASSGGHGLCGYWNNVCGQENLWWYTRTTTSHSPRDRLLETKWQVLVRLVFIYSFFNFYDVILLDQVKGDISWKLCNRGGGGGGGYLIPCWFCTFAHWQRNDHSLILMLGLFELWETITTKKSRKTHFKKVINWLGL